ncbi:MAG: SIMPL domain-containing protein, partial [Calditrichaeota bacterium]
AIWPIKFNDASNELESLYATIQKKSGVIEKFLLDNGFSEDEISVSPPSIRDLKAQGYYDASKNPFRYTSISTVTVYTEKIDNVLSTQDKLIDLGKKGIALATQDWDSRVQYLFTKLNDIKPDMIEEATKNAREAAEKFANDSNSEIGKIKSATQGQFTINNRDSNTSHIKTVRVVVTLQYYLAD